MQLTLKVQGQGPGLRVEGLGFTVFLGDSHAVEVLLVAACLEIPADQQKVNLRARLFVSSRGVGGYGHGYNNLLKPAGEALRVNKLTFTICASDSSWHPGIPGRPLFAAGMEIPADQQKVNLSAGRFTHGEFREKIVDTSIYSINFYQVLIYND